MHHLVHLTELNLGGHCFTQSVTLNSTEELCHGPRGDTNDISPATQTAVIRA